MHQNFFISASDFVQWAAVAALREAGPDVEKMRKTYDERRRFLLHGHRALGFAVRHEPTGAFYILADARRFGADSLRLAFDILERAHVGLAPGIDFGSGAEGYLRFSYANSLANLEEALTRLRRYLESGTR
jgi:aspartate/methionine/tyrosine aminotransferase